MCQVSRALMVSGFLVRCNLFDAIGFKTNIKLHTVGMVI